MKSDNIQVSSVNKDIIIYFFVFSNKNNTYRYKIYLKIGYLVIYI